MNRNINFYCCSDSKKVRNTWNEIKTTRADKISTVSKALKALKGEETLKKCIWSVEEQNWNCWDLEMMLTLFLARLIDDWLYNTCLSASRGQKSFYGQWEQQKHQHNTTNNEAAEKYPSLLWIKIVCSIIAWCAFLRSRCCLFAFEQKQQHLV